MNSIGYDIVRNISAKNEAHVEKTTRTRELAFYKTNTGNYYLPARAEGDTIANAIRNNVVFDQEIVDTAKKYIKRGTSVLDVGANFGQMTVLFSKFTGENGKVYSFDADDFVFEILEKNVKANNCLNVHCQFGAVYNQSGKELIFPEQDFVRFQTYGSYGIDFNAKTGRKVKTITIDDLNIEESISFMKVDVQGSDLFAMQGAIKTINKNRMPILFEFEYLFQDEFKLSFQDYVDFVRSIHYKFERVINGQNYLIVPDEK